MMKTNKKKEGKLSEYNQEKVDLEINQGTPAKTRTLSRSALP